MCSPPTPGPVPAPVQAAPSPPARTMPHRPRRRRVARRWPSRGRRRAWRSHHDRSSSRSARASGPWTFADGSISRRSVSSAVNCRAEISPRASRPRDDRSTWQASSSASAAREAAAAGLLISCAKPAASVPRVTRDSRCRAVASMDRAVRESPRIRCLPNGNQALTFSS